MQHLLHHRQRRLQGCRAALVVHQPTIGIQALAVDTADAEIPVTRRTRVHPDRRGGLPTSDPGCPQPVELRPAWVRRASPLGPQPRLSRPPEGGVAVDPHLGRGHGDTARAVERGEEACPRFRRRRTRKRHGRCNPRNDRVLQRPLEPATGRGGRFVSRAVIISGWWWSWTWDAGHQPGVITCLWTTPAAVPV